MNTNFPVHRKGRAVKKNKSNLLKTHSISETTDTREIRVKVTSHFLDIKKLSDILYSLASLKLKEWSK